MASPFQQQALRRKLIYIGLIVALFTASLLFRNYVVEPRADQLALREENVGAVELSGSAIRLSLTGLRGVASTILWMNAIERQKKNQWDELEILVNSITKLQPHFVTPWLFQSWNLSYNVAVRCDRPRDKYFYIARGIQLLAEGERQNQDQPELRFAMGTYYQQKISLHDHKIPLQTLFEMSGIDPVQRDPAWLGIDPDQSDTAWKEKLDKNGRPRFETFCLEHPRLVRRLREKLRCTTRKQVGEFLKDNLKIPSLFGDKAEGEEAELHTRPRLNKDRPFPVLPPPRSEDRRYDPMAAQAHELEELNDVTELEAFDAARVWYAYAQEPLPPPDDQIPGLSKPIADRIHQRLPQHMTTIIFRNYPSRAQSYIGERLEEEGWFEDHVGWKLAGWLPGDKLSTGQPAVLGTDRHWAEDAWVKAKQMWAEHGTRNRLLLPDDEVARLRKNANKFLEAHGLKPGSPAPAMRRQELSDPALVEGHKDALILNAYDRYRQLTNFAHLYERAQVESDGWDVDVAFVGPPLAFPQVTVRPATATVRRKLYEAEELRLAARAKALDRYEEALEDWAKILDAYRSFRGNQVIAEDSFEAEWNYTQLFWGTPLAPSLKQEVFAQDLLGQAAAPDLASSFLAAAKLARPQAVAAPVLVGPLDGVDAGGWPLLPTSAVQAVLARKGLAHGPMGPGAEAPPSMRGPGMGRPPGSGGSASPAASASSAAPPAKH